jgi:hypothetical protein
MFRSYICIKDEVPDQWKESIIAPVHKIGDKTDCSKYCGISLLTASYKILSSNLVSRPIPYLDEITGDNQCGFQHNRLSTDHISYIHQILEKKWEYNETVHQLFIDFKKACDSGRRELMFNILIQFGVPVRLVRLIKLC